MKVDIVVRDAKDQVLEVYNYDITGDFTPAGLCRIVDECKEQAGIMFRLDYKLEKYAIEPILRIDT